MYINHFLAWATSGKFILGEDISSIGIKPVGDRILTRNKVTKVWHIWRFPYEFDVELIPSLQAEMRERYPKVDLVFQFINQPVKLNVETSQFISQRKAAADNYEKFKAAFDSLKPTERAMGVRRMMSNGLRLTFGKEDVESKKQLWDSYMLASKAVADGKAINYTHIFIYAQAPNNREMNKFAPALRSKLFGLKLGFKALNSLMNNFLENYGPASYISASGTGFQQSFLLRENVTNLLPTKTEGLINEDGILLGVDVNNGFPFLLEFFKSGQGQTCMLGAKTGWGKTHLGFKFALGLLGAGVHVSVTDLKGQEWNKIGRYTRFLEITLTGENPRGVNTLRLDDMRATRDDCVYLYESAIDATVRVLSLMSEVSNSQNKGDLEKALRRSIVTLYNQHGVVRENPETFSKTKHLKYEDVMPFLAELETGTETMPEEVKRICNLARFRCESVLKESGAISEAFKHEITVQEILDVPMVIYSLNKNTDQDLTVAETIAVFMAEYLSTKKHHYRRRQGLHSALFAEEIQRYQDTGEIVEFLSNQTTGARSQNVMIVFLLNSLSKLNGPAFVPIKSNVSTVILGLLTEQDIEMVRKDFGYEDIYNDLVEVSKHPEDYKNVFAVSFNTGYQHGNALIRALMPQGMNKVLETRTIRR